MHGSGGSYYFCHISQTAYPRYELVSFGSQTEPFDFALVQTLDSTYLNVDLIYNENEVVNDIVELNEEPDNTGFELENTTSEVSSKSRAAQNTTTGRKFSASRNIKKGRKNNSRTKKKRNQNTVLSKDSMETSEGDIDKNEVEDETINKNGRPNSVDVTHNPNVTVSDTNQIGNLSDMTENDENEVTTGCQTKVLDTEEQVLHVITDHNYEHPDLQDHQYLKANNFHECVLCENVSFRRKFSLLKHFKKHHDNMLPFKCDKCDKKLVSLFDARKHVNMHNKDQYECQVCFKKFSSDLNLTEHQTTHTGEKPFKCHLCPNAYRKKVSLDSHLSSHSGVKCHICEYCGKAFANRAQVLKHIRCCVKKIECDVCKKMFSDPSKLKMHMRKHTGERPYICESCGCAFGHRSGLIRHIKFIHTKQKDFKCSFCEKRFVTKQTLDRHERVHTSIKSHMCTYCGKPFRELWTLKVHTRIHTGETPYSCDFCGQGFKHNVVRRKHESKCPMKDFGDKGIISASLKHEGSLVHQDT